MVHHATFIVSSPLRLTRGRLHPLLQSRSRPAAHPARLPAPRRTNYVSRTAMVVTPAPEESNPAESTTTPAKPATPAVQPTRFRLTRWAVFTAMSLTYATYVFLRSTFTYVAPTLSRQAGLTLQSVGQISSAFPLAYGLSRLLTGIVVDSMAAHRALASGLLLAGALNAMMVLSTRVGFLTAVWAANGLVQGVGAGASAKLLTAWFDPRERGFFWALWSTSANVGAFLAPVVVARLVDVSGVRAGLLLPGVFAIAWAVVVAICLRSSPAKFGFAVPWEADADAAGKAGGKEEETESWWQLFMDGVLKNRTIWLLAISYFFVYLVRSGTKSWLHFWLVETRGLRVSEAAYRASGMEVGGMAGTFSAGVLSDRLGGRRVLVTIGYLVGMIGALALAVGIPGAVSARVHFAVFALVGFCINGPQMMIGLVGAEVSDRRVLATATGVLGWISYLGAAASGFPLSVVVGRLGWPAFFACLFVSCALAVVCLLPLWRMRASVAKDKAR